MTSSLCGWLIWTFKAPETVIDALTERVKHGAFGYSLISPTYHQTFIDWLTRHHGYTPKQKLAPLYKRHDNDLILDFACLH